MKVSNFEGRNGAVKNQFIIKDGSRTIFQSYKSVIAIEEDGKKTKLDQKYWDYSKTTGRYRNQFLGENKNETLKKIEAGEYELCDLN